MKKMREIPFTYSIISLWIIIYLLDIVIGKGIMDIKLCNQGAALLLNNKEWYRIYTGSLVHINVIHLLANVTAIYWVGVKLEEKIGKIKFFTFYLLGTLITQTLLSFIWPNMDYSVGASTGIFALIGTILVLQLKYPQLIQYKLKTWSGNWILAYAILGNIPFLSFMGVSTIVSHFIGFIVGVIVTYIITIFKKKLEQ